MRVTKNDLKEILTGSFSQFTGWEKDEVEAMTSIPSDAIVIPEVDSIVGIEGVRFLSYFADDVYIYLMNKDDLLRLLLIFGEGCYNVDAVQQYIRQYNESRYGNVFRVLNDVSEPMDALVLDVEFDMLSSDEAIEMMTFLFSVLTRKEFIDVARPMLQFFDGKIENIAV